MKILVTGATGFLGFRVLEGLIQLDKVKEIVATGREIKNTHRMEKTAKLTTINRSILTSHFHLPKRTIFECYLNDQK